MRKIAATIIVLLVIFSTAFSVIHAMTDDGKKVALYEDGTWDYVVVEEFSLDDLPLKIIKAELVSDYYSSYEDAKITVENVSNKIIKAFALTFVLFDDFGDEVDQLYGRYIAQKLKILPGEQHTSVWDTYEKIPTKIHAFPVEVVYEDGSKWVMDFERIFDIKQKIRSLY
ncbi:hypothetical protein [Mesotoga sp.]|uniref:hypothetical protein n=1 Tax=Mesotoga sp. TaxID=2053577 RepID=UPI00345E4F4A